MKGEALFRVHGKQVAALCWRARPVLEVLLITSLNSKRWILPKGWPEEGLTLAENAAREAFEEAGVHGKITDKPVGTYHYLKEKKDGSGLPCSVDVFALAVTKQLHDWPEKNLRTLAWVPLDQAIKRVGELGARQVLKDFRKSHMPQKRSLAVQRQA
ncbi:MAG: NUDIX hydrolase [Alphaproteobacteria bacterium]|nr:NUDIX hydrolase [Alphaproteobacteria bacterium]